jgi:hypothetical protein
MVGRRSSLVGTRASGAGEPHPQEAHVTAAERAKLNCRTRDTRSRMARLRWLGGVGRKQGSRCRASPAPHPVRRAGRAGASRALLPTRPVPSLVRQVKGSKGRLRQREQCDASNAGTGSSSSHGRLADDPCGHRDRAAVVAGGVTTTQGHGSCRGRAKGLSRP